MGVTFAFRRELVGSQKKFLFNATRNILETRIVGGVPTQKNRYPYFSLLLFKTTVDVDSYIVCGGTLIHSNIIMTAAHCYAGPKYVNQSASFVVVAYSKLNSGFVAKIETIVQHPRYNYDPPKNDIMLIKIDHAIMTTQVKPVALNSQSLVPSNGDLVTVIGIDATLEGETGQDVLQEVILSAVSDLDCKIAYGELVIADLMICSYSPGKDSCQGDSGGPLIMAGNNAAMDVQIGIVSFGIGCAQPNIPGVYTRVSAYTAWIQWQICSLSSNPSTTCLKKSTTVYPNSLKPSLRPTTVRSTSMKPSTPLPVTVPTPVPVPAKTKCPTKPNTRPSTIKPLLRPTLQPKS